MEGSGSDDKMSKVVLAAVFLLLVGLILFMKWKWRVASKEQQTVCDNVQLVHRLCPHRQVIQGIELKEKDSLDDHLEVLTKKLADKESRLKLSKSKIREKQHEIQSLHAIDQDVRLRYRDIMESLHKDLSANEKDCRKLQQQIEWVSMKRAELRDEVHRGQRLYGQAAAELASNLVELQKGRVTEKQPEVSSTSFVRFRKGPLPTDAPPSSPVMKLLHDEDKSEVILQ